jgi:hypothetical protein
MPLKWTVTIKKGKRNYHACVWLKNGSISYPYWGSGPSELDAVAKALDCIANTQRPHARGRMPHKFELANAARGRLANS